jgi:CHASE2 domain-containing sensor protein
MLQGLELQAYDRLMQLRAEEKPDARILVVTVTEEDLHLPEQKDGKGSLSNLALEKLLQKLEQLQPRVIGLDIYRDFPAEPNYANLAEYMRQSDRFVAACLGSSEFDSTGVAPPPEVAPDRLGFSDVVAEPDNILRRHLLFMTPNPASRCTASYAFSVQLASRYLQAKGILAKSTPEGYLQLDKTIFKPLEAHTGGYQNADMKGHQVLINSHPRKIIAPQVTLKQVLTDRINPNLVKDCIVLIGTTASSYKDYLSTAYDRKIPGVMVQAQLVSHILNTVLDGRSLIWVWPLWAECLWVGSWSVVGGILAWRFRSPFHLMLASGVVLGSLYLLCFGFLTQDGWVPIVPSALALVITGASVIAFSASQTQQQQKISLLPSAEL